MVFHGIKIAIPDEVFEEEKSNKMFKLGDGYISKQAGAELCQAQESFS